MAKNTRVCEGFDEYNFALTGDKSKTLAHRDYKGGNNVIASIGHDERSSKFDPNITDPLTAHDYIAPNTVAISFWDNSQICSTLTRSNASGCQRMPDKDNFNCVIEER